MRRSTRLAESRSLCAERSAGRITPAPILPWPHARATLTAVVELIERCYKAEAEAEIGDKRKSDVPNADDADERKLDGAATAQADAAATGKLSRAQRHKRAKQNLPEAQRGHEKNCALHVG